MLKYGRMASTHRYMPAWPLPEYAFIPGQNIHPNKLGGHSHGLEEPKALPIEASGPEKNELLRFSLDLFNAQYYWECHVYLEAVWNVHERKGEVADFLKGIIMLSAAGIKLKLEQDESARGHFERALVLFETIKKTKGALFLGFELNQLLEKIGEIKSLQDFSEAKMFQIHPAWK